MCDRGRRSNPSEHTARRESLASMLKFVLVCENVEDDSAHVLLCEATYLRSDICIATDEVRTISSIRQKWQKPIAVFIKLSRLSSFVEPAFPNGVRIFHGILQ